MDANVQTKPNSRMALVGADGHGVRNGSQDKVVLEAMLVTRLEATQGVKARPAHPNQVSKGLYSVREELCIFIKSKKGILTPTSVHGAGRGWSAKAIFSEGRQSHLAPGPLEAGVFLRTGGGGWDR